MNEKESSNDRISKCISCDSSNFSYYDNHKTLDLPIFICDKCKLHVLSNSQSILDDKLAHLYDEKFWAQSNAKVPLSDDFSDSYSKGRIRIWLSQIQYCKNILSENKKILEIGCGHGEAIYSFDRSGFTVIGIEPDKNNVSNINKKLNKSQCIIGKAETFEINQKFDIIWLNHVFEHLSKPIEILKRCSKFLNNSGYVFLEVPSTEKKNDYRTFTQAPHAYNYSKLSLMNICKKANYSIIQCDYFRSPTKLEGALNKFFRKLNYNAFPYYPKILTNQNNGENIRIILQKKSI